MALKRFRLWLRSFVKADSTRVGRERIRRIRPTLEVLEDRVMPAPVQLLVTLPNDNGTGQAGTLSAAILTANTVAPNIGSEINFQVGVLGVRATITVTGVLPTITAPTVINGFSQGGKGALLVPWVELNGQGLVGDGLTSTSGNVTIQGMAIDRFDGNGIVLADPNATQGQGDAVQGNYIGTDLTGNAAGVGNNGDGVLINGSNNTVGGNNPGNYNVISGNGEGGIGIDGQTAGGQYVTANGNMVTGANSIGTDSTGLAALPNNVCGIGLSVTVGNTISAGNIVSGNNRSGISLLDGASNNSIDGNYIGVGKNGLKIVANGEDGIFLGVGVSNNTIGTIGSLQGVTHNIISGNEENGVAVLGPENSNIIVANYIGTDLTGTVKVPNQNNGIFIDNAVGMIVSNNLISGNAWNGVSIVGVSTDSTQALVAGNLIGTDITGKIALGNNKCGIYISSNDNTIGAATQNTNQKPSNVIANNGVDGIQINGGSNNLVINNFIGTDITGTQKLGNMDDGIAIQANGDVGSVANTIGGSEGLYVTLNLISNNSEYGVYVGGTNSTGNFIEGDYIGVDATGLVPLPNAGTGLYVALGADDTQIGGTSAGYGNLISANKGWGVDLESSQDFVSYNTIGLNIQGKDPNNNMADTSGWLVDNGANNLWKNDGNTHQ